MTAKSDIAPKGVLLWSATSPKTDFREAKWTSRKLEAKDGSFSFTMPKPQEGFAALFMEFSFPTKGLDFPLSTELRVVKP